MKTNRKHTNRAWLVFTLLVLCVDALALQPIDALAQAPFHARYLHLEENLDKSTRNIQDWINDLIGWNYIPTQKHQMATVTLGAIRDETHHLVLGMTKPRKYGGQIEISPDYTVTPKGREDLLVLLQTTKRDFLPPRIVLNSGFLWSNRDLSYDLKRESVEPLFRQRQSEALKVADKFSDFVAQHPEDRYLGGFAELHALLIRLNWCQSTDAVETGFLTLEKQWRIQKPIILMSKWYRLLLAALKQRGEISDILRRCIRENEGESCSMVDIAKHCLLHEPQSIMLLDCVFYTPIRRLSLLE